MAANFLTRALSFLRRGSSGREEASASDVVEEIKGLERRAAAAQPAQSAKHYKRAGDLYARLGQRARALERYGQAVNCYLESGYHDAAAALCRRMIELAPHVVRARGTLAFLSLGKGFVADARQEIRSYVHAARTAGQEEAAVARLRLIAEATEQREMLEIIGEMLLDLGDPETADRVLGSAFEERPDRELGPLAGTALEEQRERWAYLLRETVHRPPEEDDPADDDR